MQCDFVLCSNGDVESVLWEKCPCGQNNLENFMEGATNIIFPIIKAEGMVDSTPWSFDSTVLQILTGFMSFAVCGYSGVGHRATDIITMTAAGGIIEEENVIDGEWCTDEDTGVIVTGLRSEEDGGPFILSASAAVVTETVRAISSPEQLWGTPTL